MGGRRLKAMAARLIFPVMLLSVATLSACTGDSPTPSTADSASPSPVKTVQPHLPLVTVGLRGEPVPRDSCPVLKSRSNGAVGNPEPSAAIPKPGSFLICQGQGAAVPYIKADTPGFAAIEEAASRRDTRWAANACELYADVTRSIVAQTPSGSFQVYLPADGCGHYQDAIKRAIDNAWPEG